MLNDNHLLSHIFCFHLSFPALHQLQSLSWLQSLVPLQIPLPDVVIPTDATPNHLAFDFQGSGLPVSFSGTWSDFILRVHIALYELQMVALMLHRMAFHLGDTVVALHLDNSTGNVYSCNQGGKVLLQTSLPHFESG